MIRFPGKFDIRPTPDRVRETLFNWLGQTLYGKKCLDLFAGSGALGFEAASRGAGKVTMVEKNRDVAQSLAENARALGCDRLDLVCRDALEFLDSDSGVYDVIFLDPPFGRNYLPLVLKKLVGHVAENGRVYFEAETMPELPSGWTLLKSGKAGKVNYGLMGHVAF